MSKYNFDQIIERKGTASVKHDELTSFYGRDDIIPLWVADMDFAVCPEIVDAFRARLDHPVFGYSFPTDSYWNSIIQWQQKRNGFTIKREEMEFIPGIVKGLAFAVQSLTKPGDKVVIQPPVYHPFRRVVEENGRIAVTNPLLRDNDGNYSMDLDGLETVIKEHAPKMLILCNPHNPIGISWSKDTLARLAHICHSHGIIVVSDEIHGDLVLSGYRHTPFATASDEAAAISVTFGAPSKTFNIPGFVSSWAVVRNPELRSRFYGWISAMALNELSFTATLAAEAAYNNGEEWLAEAKEYIEGNIDFIASYFERNIPQIKVIRPQASFLVWLDCRALNLTHDELVDFFVNKTRIALNDGAMFGNEGTGFMRMNVASPRSILREALSRIENEVKAICNTK